MNSLWFGPCQGQAKALWIPAAPAKGAGAYIQVLFKCKELKLTLAPAKPKRTLEGCWLISVFKGTVDGQATSQLKWKDLSS